MSELNEINKSLARGQLPDCLNFFKKNNETEIDWQKVAYNTFYKSKEFVLQRFPDSDGFLKMPGGEQILEEMAANMRSPLDEMLYRQEQALRDFCDDAEDPSALTAAVLELQKEKISLASVSEEEEHERTDSAHSLEGELQDAPEAGQCFSEEGVCSRR